MVNNPGNWQHTGPERKSFGTYPKQYLVLKMVKIDEDYYTCDKSYLYLIYK